MGKESRYRRERANKAENVALHFASLLCCMFMDICANAYVCVWANVYRVMLLGDRVCVWVREGGGLVLGESVCVCVFVGRVCVCLEGVETDSRIPFALVSVGLDQV